MNSVITILLDIVPGGGGSGSDGDWGGINGDMQNLYMNMYYLCLALAGIFGLVGGYKIYAEWQLHSRHHLHITAHIAAWTGAAIFFVLAAAFISLALL